MAHMSVSEARASLPDVLDRVEAGEEVTITRHGRPVAVVVGVDVLRGRRAQQALAVANDVRAMLERGRRTRLSATAVLSPDRAEELVAAIRAGRDEA